MNLRKRNKGILNIVLMVVLLGMLCIPDGKVFAATTYKQTLKSGIDSFPKEYQSALKKIKKLHENWNFEAYYTGIPWNTVVLNETASHGRNRVHKSSDASWKCSCGNVASGYACASEGITKYYLDPRNFLNEINVFQFLEISYNSSIHTSAGVKSAVKNTFLNQTIEYKKNGKKYKKTYTDIILDAAKESNMSPYSIVTKIVQEVGSSGTSGSVSGTYKGYEGYYNFYNLGAYDTGNAIVNGLKYAKDKGWNNQYDAIVEGAQEIANSYTNAGQNTAYFYKWDVVGTSILKVGKSQTVSSSNFYWHQYMTNVQDPTSQSKSLYNTYASNGILDKKLNFIIPIYDTMPSSNGMPSGFSSDTKNLYCVNCTDGLRVRSSASTSGKVLSSLNKNAQVQMIVQNYKEADGYVWDEVKLANGQKGYAADKYLTAVNASSGSSSTPKTTTNTATAVATATTTDNLKMRKTASTSGVLLTTIPKGKQVDVLKKDAATANGYTWYQVKYGSYTGYVASKYLTAIKNISNHVVTNSNTNNSSTKATTTTTTKTTETAKTTEKLKLRKTASTSGKVMTTIPKGKKVTLVKKNAKKANGYTWHQVKYDGKTGYVASKYIKITKENTSEKTATKKETTAKTTEKLKLRKTASTSGKVVTTIPKGKKVTILKKNAKKANGYTWHQVKYDGKTGYVASKYLK